MTSTLLRRYTDLPSLIHILTARKLTLLDPSTWDDTNDAAYMLTYKKKKGLASLSALCFTQAEETYHHWKVFSSGSGGVCIRIKRDLFLSALEGLPGIRSDVVEYKKIEELKNEGVREDRLPFLKRHAYRDEAEFRVIFESKSEKTKTHQIPLDPGHISRIYLSPWLHRSLKDPIAELIHGISGCENIEVMRTTLKANKTWKRLGEGAA